MKTNSVVSCNGSNEFNIIKKYFYYKGYTFIGNAILLNHFDTNYIEIAPDMACIALCSDEKANQYKQKGLLYTFEQFDWNTI